MSKKVINKLIFRYAVEIFLLVLMVVISYKGITMNNLSQSSSIAESYSKSNNGIQFSYERDLKSVLAYENVLDKLKLTVRNPNKITKKATINLVITGNVNMEDIRFEFANHNVDLKNATKKDDMIIVPLKQIELNGFNTYEEDLFIYGDPFTMLDFTIEFDVKESLYA